MKDEYSYPGLKKWVKCTEDKRIMKTFVEDVYVITIITQVFNFHV